MTVINRVIIVDDEELSADGIKMLLTNSELPIEIVGVFYSSQAALDYLQQAEVDIVITDINMPEKNGLELIAEMRQRNQQANVIILTGFGSLAYAKEAMRYGVKYFLQKPCSPDELFDSVSSCLKEVKKDKAIELLKVKDQIENQIFGKPSGEPLVTDSFGLLVYPDKYFSMLHGTIEKVLQEKNISFTFGGLRKVVAYYLFSAEDWLGDLQSRLHGQKGIIVYQTDVELAEVKAIFEQSLAALGNEFYYPELTFLKPAQPNSPADYQAIEGLFAKAQSQLQLNSFLQAKEHIIKGFDLSAENQISVEWFKQFSLDFCLQLRKDFALTKIETKQIMLNVNNTGNYRVLQEYVLLLIQNIELKNEAELMGNRISANLNLIIEKYYGNSELSLRWISKNILYLNPDYLGKIYLRETGCRFTNQLFEVRMKKAVELIMAGYKVYEVAKMVGYENNPDYFSQLFRKKYGYSPKQFAKTKLQTN